MGGTPPPPCKKFANFIREKFHRNGVIKKGVIVLNKVKNVPTRPCYLKK